jgi:hypothetical protein
MKIERLQEILSELPNLANSGQIDRLRGLTRTLITDAMWWPYTGKTTPEEPPHLTFLSPSDTVPVTEKALGHLTHVATSLFIPNVDRQVALFMLGRLSIGKITDRKTGNAFLLAPAPALALSAPTKDLTRVVVFLYGNGTEIPIMVEDISIPTNKESIANLATLILRSYGEETRFFLYDYLGNCIYAPHPYTIPEMARRDDLSTLIPQETTTESTALETPKHETRAAAFWHNVCDLVAPKK